MFFIKRKFAIRILAIAFLLGAFVLVNKFVFAETSSIGECKDNNISVQDCPSFLQGKINSLQGQARTLASQIEIMDNQINLTEAKIEANKRQILDLTLDIDTATNKISSLQNSLNKITGVLLNRIVATYEAGRVQPLEMLLSSGNASNLLARLNYLKIAQAHDKKLIYDVQQAKNDYTNQKDILETKRKKVESLKKQLEAYTAQLEQEKQDKQMLLTVTQNDEILYQQELQAALAEQAAIEAAIVSGVQVGSVKQGDPIALVGNSGWHPDPNLSCSTGPHLHFEVRENNQWSNPTNFLKSKGVIDDQNQGRLTITLGSGDWEWPLSDPIKITQFYGQTPYSWKYRYSGGIHTGIDMVSDGGNVIRAPKDGTLYKYSQLCVEGGNIINIVYIDHGNNVVSFYLHVQ
ncbi:MAG: peptidoglycan DD-metalloendopeptidase family protein [Candidatus Levybacteria bacterium]|nr:peptidoglycan DD-metalloendopeptidase family protein [Candidatus Levybacteria bacterium]